MIDEFSDDGIGQARFSDDRRMRYRLSRIISTRMLDPTRLAIPHDLRQITRVVWVMLNPSTADAFKLDPTVKRCCEFSRRWNADIVEVVNLFALRSTDPNELLKHHRLLRGDDIENDRQILETMAYPNARVIAAWGNWGELDGRATYVRQMLRERHVELEALRFAQNGSPMHPLARGKSFIPYETQPQVWG